MKKVEAYQTSDGKGVNKMIIRHIRRKKSRKYIATFVAIPNEEEKTVSVGWAKCHRLDLIKNKENNVSNKKMGKQIATDRANSGSKVHLPFTLKDAMVNFIIRISRYYKDKNVTLPRGILDTDLQNVQ